jgi:TP901 family phage tail tape measure protein
MASKFSLEAIFNAKDKMTPVLRNMGLKVDKFAKGAKKELNEIGEINDKLVGGINKVSTALVGAAVAAGAGLAAMAKPGMEFEQQMADLGASFLKTRGEIGALEKEALSLGAATKFSATEVAGAMEAMSKAGFSEEQTLAGIKGMTYAAAAAGEDLIETTANVSSVMKGMGIDVSKASGVADVLALASVKTASSIASLGESLSKAGPVAKQFGIGLNDTTAMVALLQDAGIDASEAGSAVATMLTKLATPSKQAKEMMHKLGVQFQDSAGNMKSPALVLEQFAKASKKSGGNMKQAAFFAEMLGLRGQKAGLLLQDAFKTGKYEGLVAELNTAEGTAKKMADLRMNTLTGDIDILTENVKGLGIELFSMNSGPLRDTVKEWTKWLDSNKTEILQKIQDGVKWLVDNGPGIVKWVKRLAIAWAVFNTISGIIKTGQMMVAAYELSLKAATAAQWAFGVSGKVWAYITGDTKKATKQLELFGAETQKNTTLLGGLKAPITGIAGWLGAAGIAATVGQISFAFGTWLSETFELDKKIASVVGRITGLNDKMGGRDGRTSLTVEGDDKVFADGSVQSSDGTWKHKSAERVAKDTSRAGMVSPQERVARSVTESSESTTSTAELTIKDQTGKATMTKPPSKGGARIKLQPTGAF